MGYPTAQEENGEKMQDLVTLNTMALCNLLGLYLPLAQEPEARMSPSTRMWSCKIIPKPPKAQHEKKNVGYDHQILLGF